MTTTTVAIAGLSGRFSRCVANALLRNPHVHINGLCRSPSKLPEKLRSNPRVTVFQGGASDVPTIRKFVHRADVAICGYLGDEELMDQGQKTLIDACIAENVPRYIAGDYSLDFRPLKLGDLPPKDPMKRVQTYLEERADKITAVHVLNGCFMEVYWSFAGFWDAKDGSFKYWGTGDEKWELTTYDNTAEYVAQVALDKEANGWLQFLGDRISVKEMAQTFKDVYGQEAPLMQLGTLDDLYRKMHAVYDSQPGNMYAWMGMFYTYYTINGQAHLSPKLDNERYPAVPTVTTRDFMQKFPLRDLAKTARF